MLNLDNNTKEIEEFIKNSIQRFQTDNESPNSIGIYCCPWSGWISTNFNVNRKLTETKNNCPDFEYLEFDLLDLSNWQEEYEKDNPEFEFRGLLKNHNHDLGDENFNELIFEYLKPIVTELKRNYEFDFLLQMLDSKIAGKIKE